MVTAQRQTAYYTPEEYLSLERSADFKSEYLDGLIYAMAGSSPQHSAITANVIAIAVAALRGKPCQVFSSDLKVATDPHGLYAYPDLSIVCGEPQFHDEHQDVLTNPTVLVEVLSPSTEAYDRGRKFIQYQRIASLTDYILVAQEEPRLEHYARQGGNQWLLSSAAGLDGSLAIGSLGCTLRLAEIYDKVRFPQPPAAPGET